MPEESIKPCFCILVETLNPKPDLHDGGDGDHQPPRGRERGGERPRAWWSGEKQYSFRGLRGFRIYWPFHVFSLTARPPKLSGTGPG